MFNGILIGLVDCFRAIFMAGMGWWVLYFFGIVVPYRDTFWKEIPDGEVSIPQIIHQTYKTRELPSGWEGVPDSYAKVLPNWKYMFWSDETGRDLIADHYDWFLPTFDGYEHNIERADAVRYFILYHYGGIYVDMDIMAERQDLDNLIRGHQNMLSITPDVGLTNAFMASTKHSKFMHFSMKLLQRHSQMQYFLRHFTIMVQTGPMFISMSHASFPSGKDITLVMPKVWGKCSKCEACNHGLKSVAFFHHVEGSSWFKSDTSLIITVLCHLPAFIFFLCILISITVWYWRSQYREKKRRLRDMGWEKVELSPFMGAAAAAAIVPKVPSRTLVDSLFFICIYVASWILLLQTFDGIQLPRT